MDFNTLFSIAALALSVIALITSFILFKKTKFFCNIDNKKSLPDLLEKYHEDVAEVKATNQVLGIKINKIMNMGYKSIQKCEFLRYNPFQDAGGNQSFSLCLLDAKDNGIIISSLHGREGTRIYAKQVINGQPQNQLSDEEKDILTKALEQHHS